MSGSLFLFGISNPSSITHCLSTLLLASVSLSMSKSCGDEIIGYSAAILLCSYCVNSMFFFPLYLFLENNDQDMMSESRAVEGIQGWNKKFSYRSTWTSLVYLMHYGAFSWRVLNHFIPRKKSFLARFHMMACVSSSVGVTKWTNGLSSDSLRGLWSLTFSGHCLSHLI